MLKIFYANRGIKADVLSTVASIRAWAAEHEVEHVVIARSYVDDGGPFPERAAALALTRGFLIGFSDMVGAWADAAVEDWLDDPKDVKPTGDAPEDIAQRRPPS